MFGTTPSSGTGLFGSAQNKPSFGAPQSSTQPNASTGSGFSFGSSGNTNPPSGGVSFGQSQPSSTTSAPSTGGGLFGQAKPQTGGLFGSSSTAPATGSTGGGLFGSKPAQPSGGGLFGSGGASNTTGGSGLFSGNQSSTNNNTSGGLFGSNNNQNTQSGGGLFGSGNTQQSGGGLFGGSQNNSTGGGLFGGNNAQKPPASGGLFGGASTQNNQSGGGLFGGNNTQNNQSGGGLFGSANQNNQQQSGGLFGSSNQNNQPSGGSLFGGSTLNNSQPSFSWSSQQQQQQPQQQNPPQSNLFDLSNVSKLQPSTQSNAASSSSNTYTPPINDQLIKLKEQWDPNSPKCAFKTHLYNKFSPEEIQVLLQQPRPANEPPEEWDTAMSNRPSPLHYPVRISSFSDVAQRIEVQLDYVAKSRILLNNINEKQTQLSSKHDIDNSTRILKAKVRHAKLSRKLLRLATILAILKLRGYPLLPEEEEISKQFQALNGKITDPNGSVGKLSDLYARLAILKGRSDDLSSQLETSINNMNGGLNNVMNGDKDTEGGIVRSDDQNYVDQVVKSLTNLLYKQQVGLSFLNDLVQKDISIVDKANSSSE